MLARLFRPLWNKVAMSFGRASMKLGFTPDMWTFTSLLLSFLAAAFLSQGRYWEGLITSIAMFTADAFDGATARARKTPTKFGMILDHTVDRYAEFIVLAGLLFNGHVSQFTIMFTIAGMVMASYARAKAESVEGVGQCIVGLAGRIEKLVLIYAGIVWLALGQNIIVTEILILLAGLISHITVVQRLLFARGELIRKGVNDLIYDEEE